jgi:hypothetical protein
MTVTLEDAIKTADEWTPGCSRWDVFENMPESPKQLRWVWHGAKLLAIAQDNGDATKIERERASLINAIDTWCDAGKPEAGAIDPTEALEAQEVAPDGLSMGAKCAIGIGAGLLVGHMLKGGHGHHGALGRAVTYAAVSQIAKPAFAQLFKAATR